MSHRSVRTILLAVVMTFSMCSSVSGNIPFDRFSSNAPVGAEVFVFVSTNSGRCLTVKDGAVVQGPFATSAGSAERWKVVRVDPGHFKLINEKSGKVLAVPASSKDQGTQLIEFEDAKSKNQHDQHWEFVKVGNHYSIKSRVSGFVVAVGGQAKDENARVLQWEMAKIPDQIWYVQWLPGAGKK